MGQYQNVKSWPDDSMVTNLIFHYFMASAYLPVVVFSPLLIGLLAVVLPNNLSIGRVEESSTSCSKAQWMCSHHLILDKASSDLDSQSNDPALGTHPSVSLVALAMAAVNFYMIHVCLTA